MSRQRLILFAILTAFVALATVLLFNNYVVSMPHDESPDPLQYMKGARDLCHYDSNIHPPLYSATIALLLIVLRDSFIAAKLISLLSGVGVILLVFGLGRRCFDSERTGLLGAALTAASPLFINASYSPGSDMLSTLIFLGGIYLLARPGPNTWKNLAVAGAVAGLAYLTRYLFVGMIPAALIYLGVLLPGNFRQRAARSFIWLGGFVVVIAPWSLVCLARYGNLHNDNYVNVAFSIMMASNDNMMNWDEASKFPGLLAVLRMYPIDLIKLIAKNVLYFPSKIIVPEALVAGVALVVGLPLAFLRPSAARLLLIINFAAILVLIMLTWLKPRFFMPVLPIVILAGAYILSEHLPITLESFWPKGTAWANKIRRLPARKIGVVIALLSALLFAAYQVPRDAAERNVDDMMRAGLALKGAADQIEAVLTTSKTLAWYARLPYINIKEIAGATDSTLDRRMREAGARVLVYSERSAIWDFPQLKYLLNPKDRRIPSTLSLLYRDSTTGGVIVAYRIKGEIGQPKLDPDQW